MGQFGGGAALRQQEAQGLHRLAGAEVRRLAHFEIHVLVEQEDLHILGAGREELQVDVGMFTCRAIPDRASNIGAIEFQVLHQLQGHPAQVQQTQRLRVGKEEFVIEADFFLDLLVIGHDLAAYLLVAQDLPGGLALGAAVVGAILGDHAGGRCGDLGAQLLGGGSEL